MKSLFGVKATPDTRKQKIIAHVEKTFVAMKAPHISCRIYETATGIRLIVQGIDANPQSPEITQLFRTLNADPLYAMLCRRQNCYRARLTPKPGRMKFWHFRHPGLFADESARAEFLLKLEEYNRLSEKYAVCRFIRSVNGTTITENAYIRFHDDATKAQSSLPLA